MSTTPESLIAVGATIELHLEGRIFRAIRADTSSHPWELYRRTNEAERFHGSKGLIEGHTPASSASLTPSLNGRTSQSNRSQFSSAQSLSSFVSSTLIAPAPTRRSHPHEYLDLDHPHS